MAMVPFSRVYQDDAVQVTEWLVLEISKNSALKVLPLEIWTHIVSFVPKKNRTDAIVLGNYVVYPHKKFRFLWYKMWTKKAFITKNGPKALDLLSRKTFGSRRADREKALQICAGTLNIKTVLKMNE